MKKRSFLLRIVSAIRRRFSFYLRSVLPSNSVEDIIDVYNRSKTWIHCNTVANKGIVVSNETTDLYKNIPYPEVSGYYVPSLLKWGERDLAVQYTKWLCSIQNKDGSWNDYLNKDPYVFDTGQILKGLLAIYNILPAVRDHIIKGCDWIIDNIEQSGKLTTPSTSCWNTQGCTDLIHIYCLSPLVEASKVFNKPNYQKAAHKVLEYYKKNRYEDLVGFHTLSHFYAYIVEALVDLGETDIAEEAMCKIKKLQKSNGAIPAYQDVDWVCSTGLFQFAVIFYKLGMKDEADRAFDYASSLQLPSGGWYGSYGSGANYAIYEEISWCNKYFLDALELKIQAHFASTATIKQDNVSRGEYALEDNIDASDGRVIAVLDVIGQSKPKTLLEVGCGKGRILKHIQNMYPEVKLSGIDLDDAILRYLPKTINTKVASILNTGYQDQEFDFVCTIECLEHAVDIHNAVKEMARITKKGGTVMVLDKNKDKLGVFDMPPWEQWFDIKELTAIFEENGLSAQLNTAIPYEKSNGKDGLFIAWIGTKL